MANSVSLANYVLKKYSNHNYNLIAAKVSEPQAVIGLIVVKSNG